MAVVGILLAGGEGRRFGGNKLLQPLPAAAHSGPAFLFRAAPGPQQQPPPPSLAPLAAAVLQSPSSPCLALAVDEALPYLLDVAQAATPLQRRALQARNLYNVRTARASQRQPLHLYAPLVLRYRLFGATGAAGAAAAACAPCHLALLPLPTRATSAALPTARQGSWDPWFPCGPSRGFVNVALGMWYEQQQQWVSALALGPALPAVPAAAAAAATAAAASAAAAVRRQASSIQAYLPHMLDTATFALPAPVPLAAMVEALTAVWAADDEEEGVHEVDTE